MKAHAYWERPSKTGFGMFWFLVSVLIAGCALNVCGAQDAPADNSQPARTNSIYAKIVLPMKAPAEGKFPLVESWIAKKLENRGKSELRAVTHWVRLAEEGEDIARVWNATLDGKTWGCPVAGRVVERTPDGRVKVSLSGWAPDVVKVKGTTLPAETGSRRIAVVDHGTAYVALFVGPQPAETGSAPHQ